MKRRDLWIRFLSFLAAAAAVAGWHFYVTLGKVPAFILPGPEAVARQLISMVRDGSLLFHMGITSAGIVTGFLIGSVLGFVLGYFLAKSRVLEAALFPYLIAVQATPKVTLIPLFVIWFGLGLASKLLLVVLSAFFPVLLNTVIGFRSVPREYYELMRILNATERQMLYKVKLPLSLPILMAGLKVAMVQAVIGTIVAEWVSGKSGLGYLLVYGSTQFDSRLLLAAIFATTLVGLFFFWIIEIIESRALFWHESKIILEEGL